MRWSGKAADEFRFLFTQYLSTVQVLYCTLSMEWSGSRDWRDPRKTRRGLWVVDDYPAGYSRTLRNLEFVVVYNSGHLVPLNQPKNALDLLNRVLQNKTFIDKELPVLALPTGKKQRVKEERSNKSQIAPPRRWGLAIFVAALLGFLAGVAAVRATQRSARYDRL